MKNVLLLTDFSKNSINAIHYAMHFFKTQKCVFHILYVHKIGTFSSDDLMYNSKESIYKSITKEPKKKLNKIKKELIDKYKNSNHSFKIHIDFDVFVDAIKQVVKAQSIDYIIMGTNGVTGAKEVLLGSNTVNVIKKVHCKTLIIPENYTFLELKEILLPLDPEDKIEGTPFTNLLEFIDIHQLNLYVLRINKNQEDAKLIEQDKANLSIINCNYQTINNVPVQFAITSYMQTNAINILALFKQKETILDKLFASVNSKFNLDTITYPLLILHS